MVQPEYLGVVMYCEEELLAKGKGWAFDTLVEVGSSHEEQEGEEEAVG